MTSDLDYDETWCGFLCQHPECWKSYTRSAKGNPKKPDNPSPLNQSPKRSFSTGLPTLKICSIQAFGDEDSSDEFDEYDGLEEDDRTSASSRMSPLHESFHPTRKIIIVNQTPPLDIAKKTRACSLPIIPNFLEGTGSPGSQRKEFEGNGSSPQQHEKGFVSVVSMENEFRPWEESKLAQSFSSKSFYRWIPNPRRRRYQQFQEQRLTSLPFPRDITTQLLSGEINESERFVPRQKERKTPSVYRASAARSMNSWDSRYKSSVPLLFDRDTLFEEPIEEYAKSGLPLPGVVFTEKSAPPAQTRKLYETKPKKETLKTQVKITKLSPWSDGSSEKDLETEDEHFMSTKQILEQLQLQPKKSLNVSIHTPVGEDQLKRDEASTIKAPPPTATATATVVGAQETRETVKKPKIPATYSLHMMQRTKPKQGIRKNARFKSEELTSTSVDDYQGPFETPYQTAAPSPEATSYDTAFYRQRNHAQKMQTQTSPFTWAPPPSPASKAQSRRVAIVGVKYRGQAVDVPTPTRPDSDDHMRVLHHIDARASVMTLTVMPPLAVSSQPTTLTVQLPQELPPPPKVPDTPLSPNSLLRTLASQPTANLNTSLVPSTPPLATVDSLLRIEGRSLEDPDNK